MLNNAGLSSTSSAGAYSTRKLCSAYAMDSEVSTVAYPNPTSGKIEVDASEKITDLSVYSLSGALVMKIPGSMKLI